MPGELVPHDGGSLGEDKGGWVMLAPSALAYPGLKEPEELTEEKIDDLVQAFAAAAARAVAAGFDFIEIHGAHGYRVP